MLSKNSLSVGNWVGQREENKRTGILADILIVAGPLLILGVLGEWLDDSTTLGAVFVNLAYILSLGAATVVLRSRGLGWRDVGLARPGSWPKTILLGIGVSVIAMLAGLALQLITPLIPGLEIAARDQSNYSALTGNLPLLILFVAAAWTIVAFGEEMIFRAFLTNSLARLFLGKKGQWALALIGSSIVFGLAHYSWGLAGILETTVIGFVFGAAYLLSGHNLWVSIIAHGLANTVVFVLVFSGIA